MVEESEPGEIVGRKPGKIGLSVTGYELRFLAIKPLSYPAVWIEEEEVAHGLARIFTDGG